MLVMKARRGAINVNDSVGSIIIMRLLGPPVLLLRLALRAPPAPRDRTRLGSEFYGMFSPIRPAENW